MVKVATTAGPGLRVNVVCVRYIRLEETKQVLPTLWIPMHNEVTAGRWWPISPGDTAIQSIKVVFARARQQGRWSRTTSLAAGARQGECRQGERWWGIFATLHSIARLATWRREPGTRVDGRRDSV